MNVNHFPRQQSENGLSLGHFYLACWRGLFFMSKPKVSFSLQPAHPSFIGPRLPKYYAQLLRSKRYNERKTLKHGVLRQSHPLFIGPRISPELSRKVIWTRRNEKEKLKVSLKPHHHSFIGPLIPRHERHRLHSKEWNAKNRVHIRKIQAAYRVKAAPRFKERKRLFYERHKVNPDFKLRMTLSGRMRSAVKAGGAKKAARTLALVGCTTAQLRAHLEAQFQPGMTWQNHGNKGWHIDHIFPCANFDLTNPESQRMCFHYTNLRPLWGRLNMAKGDRICREALVMLASGKDHERPIPYAG